MKAVGKYVDIDSEDVDNSSRCSNDELVSDGDDDIIIVDEDVDNDSVVDSEEQNSGEIHNNSPTKGADDKVMLTCLLTFLSRHSQRNTTFKRYVN